MLDCDDDDDNCTIAQLYLPYNKCVVSRDSDLASLLGAITITNLFPLQHKFMQCFPP